MKNYINSKKQVEKEITFYKNLRPLIEVMNEHEIELCIKLRRILLRKSNNIFEAESEVKVKNYIKRKYESLDKGKIRNEEDIYLLNKFRPILTGLSMGKYNLFYVRRSYLLEKNRINMFCYNY